MSACIHINFDWFGGKIVQPYLLFGEDGCYFPLMMIDIDAAINFCVKSWKMRGALIIYSLHYLLGGYVNQMSESALSSTTNFTHILQGFHVC